jgi:hypothetical protein
LRRLIANSLPNITDVALQSFCVLPACKNITYLSLADCPKLTDASLTTVAENFPLLNFIRIEKWRISVNGLRKLLESCGDLEEAYINNCVELNIQEAKKIIRMEFLRVKALIS